MQPQRTITIEVYGANDFDVRCDGAVQDRLCWDEMLGTIAQMTHRAIGHPRFNARPESELCRHPRPEPEEATP